jgi:hypothetical protein
MDSQRKCNINDQMAEQRMPNQEIASFGHARHTPTDFVLNNKSTCLIGASSDQPNHLSSRQLLY